MDEGASPYFEIMNRSLRRASRGNRPGFQHLYTTHLSFLRAALRWQGVARQDMEDVQQDVLLAIHRGLPQFLPSRGMGRGRRRRPLSGRRLRLARRAGWSPLKAWIYGIVWRQASHYHQRAHRAHEVAAEPDAVRALAEGRQRGQAGAREQAAARAERAAILAELIAKLRPERRLVLVLCDVLGIGAREVSCALELPLSTAQTRLRLARLDLRAAVQRLDPERREALRQGLRLGAFAGLTPSALERAGGALRGVVAAWRRLAPRFRRGLGRVGEGIANAGERAAAGSAAAGGALALGLAAVTLSAGVVHGCAAAQVAPGDPAVEDRAVGAVAAAASSSGESARLGGPGAPVDWAILTAAAPAEPSAGSGAAPADPSAGSGAAPAEPHAGSGAAPADPHAGSGAAPPQRPVGSDAERGLERAAQPSADRRAVAAAPAASVQGSGGARANEEQALLRDAFGALVRGDLAGALERLTTHAARYPRSQLAGSRERLRGRVLARMASRAEPPRPPPPALPARAGDRDRDRDRPMEQGSEEHSE